MLGQLNIHKRYRRYATEHVYTHIHLDVVYVRRIYLEFVVFRMTIDHVRSLLCHFDTLEPFVNFQFLIFWQMNGNVILILADIRVGVCMR